MRKWFAFVLAAVLAASPLQARPERIEIKSKERKSREYLAEREAKIVHLRKIQDPEVRKALKAVFDALELPVQG